MRASKYLFILFCLAFALVSLASLAWAAAHAGHECTGAHCEVCLHITRTLDALKQLRVCLFCAAFLLFSMGYRPLPRKNQGRGFGPTNLSLKVQLNI